MDGPGTYDTDFVRWTEEQAAAIRAAAASRTNLPFDWENVAADSKDSGKPMRREFRARLLGRLLQLRGETTPAIVARLQVAGFTTDRVAGDWFPPEVAAAAETP